MKESLESSMSFVFEELEPRILYSADFAPGLVDDAGLQDSEVRLVEERLSSAVASASSDALAAHGREIFFIDAGVQDYQQLLDAVQRTRGGQDAAEIVVLDASRDGVEQISEHLGGRSRVTAVHIISHGENAAIRLGNAELSAGTLPAYDAALAQWQGALNADADILIYGCNVAATASGQAFVQRIAQLTGADVAASIDLTGSRELGGDWDLELRAGAIESIALGYSNMEFAWDGALATYTVNSTADTNTGAGTTGTLRWVINQANASAGVADTINFNIAGGGLKTITLSSALPTITDKLAINGYTQNGASPNTLAVGDNANLMVRLNGSAVTTGTGLEFSGAAAAGSSVSGLMITGFGKDGIHITNTNNVTVTGNFIGTDGTNDLGNTEYGIVIDNADSNVIGGSTPGGRNVISGNNGQRPVDLGFVVVQVPSGGGVKLTNDAALNLVQGNYIGTSASGTLRISNGLDGVEIDAGAHDNTIRGNVISGNGDDGVQIAGSTTSGNRILDNWIGVTQNATAALGNGAIYTLIVSVPSGDGVWIENAPGNIITGNVIGNNQLLGVGISGASATGNVVQGNAIGTDFTGIPDFGNGDAGIALRQDDDNVVLLTVIGDPSGNTIGGVNAGEGNIVAFSTTAGVEVGFGTNNSIRGNRIYNNAGLGIDLGPTVGVTNNDAGDLDTGPNNLQNFPVLTSATINGAQVVISGTINTNAGASLVIDFYASANPTQVSGAADREGARYIGSALVTADGSGNATFNNLSFAASVTTSDYITATATTASASGNTSEFSAGRLAALAPVNSAPTLDASKAPTLATVNEDAPVPSGAVGTLVSALVEFTGGAGLNNVTDPDAGALLGIAITAADATNGTWWYSINNGANWSALGAVTNTSARLLAGDSNTRIYFQPNANYNGSIADAITFRAWDQTSGTNGAAGFNVSANGGATAFSTSTDTASLTVTGVNDAPVLVTNAGATVNEGATVTIANTRLNVTDSDNLAAQLTYTITALPANGSLQLNAVPLFANGTFTQADINAGLVTYLHNGSEITTDSFTFTVSDGAGGSISSRNFAITVTPVNDAPVLTLPGPAANFTEGGAALVIDGSATVFDADSPNFAGGTLRVDFTAGGSADDRLSINNEGVAAGQIGVSGTNVTYSGTTIGSFGGGANGSSPLLVTLNSNATQTAVQALVHNITYQSVGVDPSTLARTVRFVVTDGNSGTSADVTKTVNVFGDNTLVVTTTLDNLDGDASSIDALLADRGADGKISLREAIAATNATVNVNALTPDRIYFNITDPLVNGAHTIALAYDGADTDALADALPHVTGAVVIDGTSEPDFSGTPIIELNGSGTDANASGLYFAAGSDGSTVRGLVINRFGLDGIQAFGSSNHIFAGNYIGTDVTGTLDLGNAGDGIRLSGDNITVGGNAPADRNVIAGNSKIGVRLGNGSSNTVVQGNLIGIGTGGQALGNNSFGVYLGLAGAANNRIGGVNAGEANVIAYNAIGGVGASLTAGTGNAIRGNAIYSNGALGIDLGATDTAADGVTANDTNDVDSGVNGLQNFPELWSAIVSGTQISVSGTINTNADLTGLVIDFYATNPGQLNGAGDTEGARYLGSTLVNTNASGNATFTNVTLSASVAAGEIITATATTPGVNGNTSEFSAGEVAVLNVPPVNNVPGAQTVNEDGSRTIGALSVSDSNIVSVQLSVLHGRLIVPDVSGGATITGSGTGSVTITWSSPRSNPDLAGDVTYLPNADYNGADTLTIVSTNIAGATDTDGIAITVNAVNDAPALATNIGTSVNEGASVILSSGMLTVTDVDNTPAQLVYTAVPANGRMELVSAPGTVISNFTQDDLNNSRVRYVHDGSETASGNVSFTVSDGAGGVLAASTFAITVNAVNDAPTLATHIGLVLDEGASAILTSGLLQVTDVDNAPAQLVYTVATVPANGALHLNGTALAVNGTFTQDDVNSNRVSYLHNGSETSADSFTFALSDGAGGTIGATSFAITVNLVNDAPTLATNAGLVLNEGAGAIITPALLQVLDADNAPTQLLYTVGTIPANGALRLNGTGLAVNGTFTQDDVDNNRVSYLHNGSETSADSFTFTLSDGVGGAIGATGFAISVNPVNDNAPVITSDGAGASAAVSVAENGAAVTTVTANDADLPAQTLTYSIVGGADAVRFVIDNTTGALSFAAAPDFEAPADADGNNVYLVRVQVADGLGGVDTQDLSVTVTNVNEGGVSAIADADAAADSVNENAALGTAVGITVNASDADTSDTITYALDNDAGGRFAIDTASGVITVVGALDFEASVSHNIIVRASSSDGSATTRSFTINLLDQNDNAPVIGAGQVFTIAENAANASSLGAATATDIDTVGGLQNWAIVGGTGSSAFAINAATGAITVADASQLNYEGSPSFTLQVSVADGVNTAAMQTLTINLTNVNEAPQNNAPASHGAVEDVAEPISGVSVGDVDTNLASVQLSVDSGAVSVSLAGGAAISAGANASSSLTLTGTQAQINAALGSISYQSASDFNGTDTLGIVSIDAAGLSDSDAVNITVAAVNDAPTLAAPIADQSATEEAAFGFTFAPSTFNEVDASDTLTYSASGVPGWLSFNAATRTFSGTPTNADVGAVALTVRATDLSGAFVEDVFNITIGNANDAPTVANPIPDQAATEDMPFTFTVPVHTFNDIDAGDSLTYSASGLPTWLMFDAATHTLSGTPANGDVGTVALTVRATDLSGAFVEDTFNVVVGNVNDAPTVATSIPDQAAIEDALFTFTFAVNTFNDGDTGDTLTYSASGSPTWLTFDAATRTRTFSGTPTNADVGTVALTVRATDLSGVFVEDVFNITVGNANDAPAVANPIADQAATEDAPFTFTFAANTFNDIDAGDSLNYSASGLPAWLTFDVATRTFSGTPANADVGSYTISLRASDASGAFAENTFDVSVANTNDAPVISSNGGGATANVSVVENTLAVTTVGASDVDLPAQSLSFSVSGGADAARFSINASGALSFAVAPDFEAMIDADGDGIYEVEVQVADGAGGVDTQVLGVSVLDVNEGGASAIRDNDAAADGVRENAAPGTAVGITAFSDDVDVLDTISYVLDDDAGGRFAIDAASGVITVTGPLDYEAALSQSVLVRATSSDGSFATRRFTINLLDENDNAPVIGAGQIFALAENVAAGTLAGTVQASDADTVGKLQNWAITGGSGAAVFAIDAATGAISVADAAQIDFERSPSFTLDVSVSDGISTAAAQRVTINIVDVNEAPQISTPGGQSLNEDGVLAIGAVSVADADGNLAGVQVSVGNGRLRVDLAGGASIGAGANDSADITLIGTQAQINDALASIVYLPAVDFNGSDTLSIVSTDGGGLEDRDSVAINVNAVNDAPRLTVASLTVAEGATVTLTTVQLNASDAEQGGVQLAFALSDVSGGFFEFADNPGAAITNFTQADIEAGRVRFVHDGGEAAPSFQAQVSDVVASDGPRSASITFTNVNDVPTLTVGSATVAANGSVALGAPQLQTGDADHSATQLVYTLTAPPANGRLEFTDNPGVAVTRFTQADIDSGRLTYVARAGANGSDSFSFTVTDGTAAPIAASFAVAPAPAPVTPPPTPAVAQPTAPISAPPLQPPQLTPTPGAPAATSTDSVPPAEAARATPEPRAQAAPAVQAGAPAQAEAAANALPSAASGVSLARRAGQAAEVNPSGVTLAQIAQPQFGFSGPAAQAAGRADAGIGVTLSDSGYARKLDEARRRLDEQLDLDKIVVSSTVAVGSSLSILSVMWALRAAPLLSGALAMLPAWTSIDPLPVLGKVRDEDEDEDEESLQSLVQRRWAAVRGAQGGVRGAPQAAAAVDANESAQESARRARIGVIEEASS